MAKIASSTFSSRRIVVSTLSSCLLTMLVACSASDAYKPLHAAPKGYWLEWLPRGDSVVRYSADGEAAWEREPVFVLRNVGSRSFLYSLECSEPWLGVSGSKTGMLIQDQATVIRLAVIPDQVPESAGRYTAEFRVLNWATCFSEIAVEVTLVVSRRSAALAPRTSFSELDPSARRGESSERFTNRPPPPESVLAPEVGDFLASPSPDSRLVFVSSQDGDDGWDGLSKKTPKKTIASGVGLLRDGFPDRLHIKRGDVFTEGLGNWTKSGRSRGEPMVVMTYGDAKRRPQLRTGVNPGLTVHGDDNRIADVAFVGLEFVAHTHDGANGTPSGVSLLEPCERVVFEDCWFEKYFVNLVLQGEHRDLAIRRCVIVDAFTVKSGHAQGIYVDGVDGCLIEQCLFDHNGWREDVAGARPDIFRHNIYVQHNCKNVTLRGNIIARGASHGAQMRSGGLIENNLFIQNAIGLLVGMGLAETEGVAAVVEGNVFLDGRDIDDQSRGWAIDLVNVASASIINNVIAMNESGTDPQAIRLDGEGAVGVQQARISGNLVFEWGRGVLAFGDRIGSVDLFENEVQEPREERAILSMPPSVSVRSRRNVFFSAAPEDQWIWRTGYVSMDEWRKAVQDIGSRAERREHSRPDLPGSTDTAAPWSMQLEAFLEHVRLEARVPENPAPTGHAMCGELRTAFGLTGN